MSQAWHHSQGVYWISLDHHQVHAAVQPAMAYDVDVWLHCAKCESRCWFTYFYGGCFAGPAITLLGSFHEALFGCCAQTIIK